MNTTHLRHANLGRLLPVRSRVRTALVAAIAVTGIALGSGALSAVPTSARFDGSPPTRGAPTANAADEDLLEAARAQGGVSAFVALVEAAELNRLFKDDGPLTVFAPHNAAFATAQLLGRRDREDIRRLVLRHVVRGWHDRASLAGRRNLNSMAEDRSSTALSVERVGDQIIIGGEAWIVGESIQTRNGVIHVVSRVLG